MHFTLRFAAVVAALAGAACLVPACGSDAPANDCNDPNTPAPQQASVPFGDACCADADCATGTCADFSSKGLLCSKPCAGDQDCVGLGPGKCGGMGDCAVPD